MRICLWFHIIFFSFSQIFRNDSIIDLSSGGEAEEFDDGMGDHVSNNLTRKRYHSAVS